MCKPAFSYSLRFLLVLCLFQDAKKGVLFIDFPPVLQLQLKRFEYDFMGDTMVKVSVCLYMARLFSPVHV